MLISIVVLVATMLGGAFMGYRSGEPSRLVASDDAPLPLDQDDAATASTPSRDVKPSAMSAPLIRRSNDASGESSLAEAIRSNDKAALDRLLPIGIREIEGNGGHGLSRMVKSHGMWFPVFDLSGARRTAANPSAPASDPNKSDAEIDPEKVKLNKVPLSIIAPPPSSGVVGQVLSMSFAAVGGTPPYVWGMQSSAATSFVIDPASGILSGSTTAPTNASFIITVHDSAQEADSISAMLKVTPADELRIISPARGVTGIVGESFSTPFAATGGVPPLTWTLVDAPAGWACTSDGTVTGSGDEPAQFNLTIQVSDSQGSTDEASVPVTVTEGLRILASSKLLPAAPGEQYSHTFKAEGGTEPYRWSLVRGSLPPGWRLSNDGTLEGIAGLNEQTYAFTIGVHDAGELQHQGDFQLAIRRLLVAVPSRNRVGLAWKFNELMRAAGEAQVTINDAGTITRDGAPLPDPGFRAPIINFVDNNVPPGTHRYTVSGIGSDGQLTPVTSTIVTVLPMSLKRGVAGASGDPYADRVKAFYPLSANGYGAAFLPTNVTGPPDGHDTFFPAWQATEVASLHASKQGGGNIVLEFTDNIIADDPGPDFTVFENVPFVNGDPNNRYMEPAIVEVALFDDEWYRLPTRVSPPTEGAINFRNPAYYAAGFAGVNPTTGDDPTDPTRSGGDSYDLASLGKPWLSWVRYVRIRSTGDGVLTDSLGTVIRHTSENNALSGNGTSGFDLDAVSAAHY